MKKFRTIAGQRLHTTYQGKLLARPFHSCKVESSRTVGPGTSNLPERRFVRGLVSAAT